MSFGFFGFQRVQLPELPDLTPSDGLEFMDFDVSINPVWIDPIPPASGDGVSLGLSGTISGGGSLSGSLSAAVGTANDVEVIGSFESFDFGF